MQQSAINQLSIPRLSSTALAVGWLVLGCALAMGLFFAQQTLLAVGVLGVVLTLALFTEPQLATVIVVFLLYSNALPVANTFHGVPRMVAAMLPLLLIVPLFHELVVKQKPIVLSSILPWLLAFLGVQALGVLVADQPDVAFKALATSVAEGLLLFLVMTNVIRTPGVLRWALWAAVLAGFLVCTLGVFQYATNSFDNNFGGFAQVEEFNPDADPGVVQEPRLAGSLGEKNRYAHFMLMLLPLALYLAWTERNSWLRYGALTAGLMIAVGIALTLSRGAAVGFGVLIVALTVIGRVPMRYLLSLAVLAALILVSVPQYTERLQSVVDVVGLVDGSKDVRQFDVATVGRLTEMWAGLQVFLEHPIVGVGGNMFPYHFLDHADDLGVQVHAEPRMAHNLYLGMAAEHGLLGLLCFFGVVLGVFHLMQQMRNMQITEAPEIPSYATAFILALVVYLTVGMFADFSYVRFFWLMMALACATYHIGAELSAKKT
ncbi:MAG: O-antigen ligase family protein [Pirellulales bacterium]|nr:O-antigen ligase family protein [Pirellulales bacterium]